MEHNPYQAGEQQMSVSNDQTFAGAAESVRGMQIIAAAMMTGVLSFMFVVLVATQGNVFGFNKPPVLTRIGAGLGAFLILNHFVVPEIVSSVQLQRITASGLLQLDDESQYQQVTGIYRIRLIIALAMLEGAAFLNLVVLMVEKNGLSLGVVVLLLGLMLVRFPTQHKVSSWVSYKLREIKELSQ
jgi:hypothetical protein